jgi:hypothetical protein
MDEEASENAELIRFRKEAEQLMASESIGVGKSG